MTIDPGKIPHQQFHQWMLSSVIPRPIAFASTVDAQGHVNISPFSFFNCFGSNPPILIFSPSRRGRDNTVKHTYENVKQVPEVVINLVSYSMVEQASLASCEYPRGVNEFVKAGLTEVTSDVVRPPRAAESPVAFECRVKEVVELGTEGGAGNLVICEILRMHIQDRVLNEAGKIDPLKLDVVARMGGDQYLRILPEGVFVVPKPNEKLGIGIDALPDSIRQSEVLTGNELACLANVSVFPIRISDQQSESIASARRGTLRARHEAAQTLLRAGRVDEAWQVLLD